MELIAHTFGAPLYRRQRRIRGLIRATRTTASAARFLPERFRVFVAHRYSVKELPPQLIELARSSGGVEVFRHANRPVFGLQFHPEVRRFRNDGKKVFQEVLTQILF